MNLFKNSTSASFYDCSSSYSSLSRSKSLPRLFVTPCSSNCATPSYARTEQPHFTDYHERKSYFKQLMQNHVRERYKTKYKREILVTSRLSVRTILQTKSRFFQNLGTKYFDENEDQNDDLIGHSKLKGDNETDLYEDILVKQITNKTKTCSINDSATCSEEKQMGLKIPIAEFCKKIKDNEGMNISTFSYMEKSYFEIMRNNVDRVLTSHSADSKRVHENAHIDVQFKKRRCSFEQSLSPCDKFRRGVKTINLLIKACSTNAQTIKKDEALLVTFSDLTDEIQDINKNRDQFELNNFKTRTERSLTKEAKAIFCIHPHQRTPEQLRVAQNSLCSAVKEFNEFPKRLQESLVKVCWYEKFGPKRVIIRQGHSALNFYFIVCGVTVVTVARQNKNSGAKYAETVAFLKKGNSFGELALMYGGKRSATVSCKDNVELLAVSRDDFIQIFMNLNADSEPDHIQFLRQLPLLEGWPIDRLPYDDPSICLLTYCRSDTVLCVDSNKADWVYVIMSGNCRVIKSIPAVSSTIPRFKCKTRFTEEFPVQRDPRVLKYHKFIRQTMGIKKENESFSQTCQGQMKKEKTQKVEKTIFIQLKTLGPKEIFGLEPITFQQLDGATGVTLVSEGAEIILISKTFFIKHISESYRKFLRFKCQPFPKVEYLVEKLQNHYNWNTFKDLYLQNLIRNKQNLNRSALL